MKLMEWLFGTDDQADELLGRVAELEAEMAGLRTSVELQRQLIRALRDVNADLDRRMA